MFVAVVYIIAIKKISQRIRLLSIIKVDDEEEDGGVEGYDYDKDDGDDDNDDSGVEGDYENDDEDDYDENDDVDD